MTREERIRAHQQKIEQIIQENRKRQEEEAKKAAEARQTPAAPAQPGQPAAPPPQPGQPGAPLPPGPVQAVVPGQQQAAPPPPASPPAAARSESRSMVFMRPFDSAVFAGETFQTEIVVDCKETVANEISVLMSYPDRALNLLAVDFAPIAQYLDAQVEYDDAPPGGQAYFHARLKSAQKFPARTIAYCYWEALAPSDLAEIRFEFGKGLTTAISMSGTSILGTAPGSGDGVIHATVMIRSPKRKNYVQRVGDRGILVTSSRTKPPSPTIGLRLESDIDEVARGEEFSVNVVLDNPETAPFDRIRLYIQFDPSRLEIVDSDHGNWIRQGVNIRDGIAHDDFPFDFHRANLADNTQGLIIYDEAMEFSPIRSSGIVAQIRFRAKQKADRTDIVLVRNKPGISPNTNVTYLNRTMLLDYPQQTQAIAGLKVRIAGELAGETRLAEDASAE
jgi:hypothetical protein